MESGGKYDVDILRRIEDTTLNDQELARQMNLIDDYEMKNSDIRTYFSGKVIFITGATGFMGKVLLEKMLRTCSELEKVYILIRSKKNKSPIERMEEVFSDPLYQEIKKAQPDFRSKVHLISGNLSLENLGISSVDLELLQKEVTNIFHLAATVKFDEPIQVAVDINIKGTLEILKFAKKCEHLETIIHVSTAFSNCHLCHIEERLYPPPMKAETIIGLVDSLEEKQLAKITPEILGAWPNTYTFTKSITEDAVGDHGLGLPIAIFRPSIVIATNREPISGWSDNVYGPSGILVGAGIGLLRVMCVDNDKVTDLIPVDYAISALIACAWKQSKLKPATKSDDIPIYNYVSGPDNPITWGEYEQWNNEYGRNVPTIKAIWHMMYFATANPTLFLILEFFLHTIPAKVFDLYCYITGKPQKASKIMNKIGKLIRAVSFFSLREFTFKNFNVRYLWNELNEADKQLFKFDLKNIDWAMYFANHIMGLRVYVVKDPPSTLPEARIKKNRLRLYDRILKVFLLLILLGFLWCICKCLCWLFK